MTFNFKLRKISFPALIFCYIQITETMRACVGITILSEENKGHSLRAKVLYCTVLHYILYCTVLCCTVLYCSKAPKLLNTEDFHKRAEQSRFVVVVTSAPPGTGIILR